MAVQIESNANRRMAEAFLGHLGVHAGEQELGRMTMAQIMKPNPRDILHKAGDLGKLMAQAARWHRLTIRAGA